MAHVRKQIRDAVVTAVTGLTTTGTSVYKSRPDNRPVQQARDLPGLFVYTTDETSELDNIGAARGSMRELSVVIEGKTYAIDDLDDALDTMAEEIEIAMIADKTLGGLSKDLYLASTVKEYDGGGEQPIGVIRMIYEVQYRVLENAPGAAV